MHEGKKGTAPQTPEQAGCFLHSAEARRRSPVAKNLFPDKNVFDILESCPFRPRFAASLSLIVSPVRFPALSSTVSSRACAAVRPAWLSVTTCVTTCATTCVAAVLLAACDQGFAPPDEPPTGSIVVDITYENHPEAWPVSEDIYELLFVALRFVPKDTTDFLQLNRLVFSDRLQFHVAQQTVTLDNVAAGVYPYAGVAHKYGPELFEWRPIGLVEDNGGIIVVPAGEAARVSVSADFLNPPPFPPPEAP